MNGAVAPTPLFYLRICLVFGDGSHVRSQPLELNRNVQLAHFWAAFVVTVYKNEISTKTKQNPANRDG